MRLRFAKYEGLGNDFVVIDAERETDVTTDRAAELCDRRFGIGADGIILVLPANGDADARMRVINSDGSVPEMCGNGIRCVALHLARARGARSHDLLVETDAGPRACALMMRSSDAEADVSVDMGHVKWTGSLALDVLGEHFDLELANAGNPHAIAFVEDAPRERATRFGETIAKDPHFPEGTNVELARIAEDGVDVVVWERGAGLTLACGTGACAVAVVAQKKKLVPPGTTRVRLPGGALDIAIEQRDMLDPIVRMRGPARLVYEGILA